MGYKTYCSFAPASIILYLCAEFTVFVTVWVTVHCTVHGIVPILDYRHLTLAVFVLGPHTVTKFMDEYCLHLTHVVTLGLHSL